MTRKQTRLTLILSGLALLGLAVGLVLFALRDSIVFFYTPSEMIAKNIAPGTRVRLGGLVEKGSLVKGDDGLVTFRVTDMTKTMNVTYKGLLPDLFREGQGVVAEGSAAGDGSFKADSVLAKHDEKYMPKEIVDKLKAQGEWKPEAGG
ncbi:cytochrome c maturation protein CcmE [Aestuariivirga litoralis]|uniref:cytochrome c maturation protein CcmE n=1 Tax=Aestuariivirga litoralis TaxID=2650924 RepID=UPI0018C6E88C|nr:cytochrome c maturation protein CcmE [Aestuariivirga litoralis]MBG1232212.1 cytochrome c maturation protein CcmE [Aestuariivirga litoralis]